MRDGFYEICDHVHAQYQAKTLQYLLNVCKLKVRAYEAIQPRESHRLRDYLLHFRRIECSNVINLPKFKILP